MEVKDNIINTSAKLFGKLGLRSVSIDDICAELHISKKTFYNCFEGKAELVAAVLDNTIDVRARKSFTPRPGVTMVDEIMSSYSRFASHHATIAKHIVFLYDLEKYYPELNRSFKQRLRELDKARIAETIRRGIAEGVFRDDLNVDFTAAVVSDSLSPMMERKNSELTSVRRMMLSTDIFLHIVCNERGLEQYYRLRSQLEPDGKTRKKIEINS